MGARAFTDGVDLRHWPSRWLAGLSPSALSAPQLSPGSGYSYTGAYGLSFTAYSGMSLDSVTLFPSGAGTSTIVIEDASNGSQLYSISVSTTATGYAAEQVYLGASLPSGSYKIWLNGTTTGGLYDNLNSTYPYWSGDSSIVITGDRNGGTSWYEYFYDWKVTVGGCEREDSTFTVSVYPDAVAAISVDTANATIGATDWMANWSTSGTANADSIYVELRWEHIQRVYELCDRNVSETARRLNMHRRTLQRILAKRSPR